jgi:hypothetical protein
MAAPFSISIAVAYSYSRLIQWLYWRQLVSISGMLSRPCPCLQLSSVPFHSSRLCDGRPTRAGVASERRQCLQRSFAGPLGIVRWMPSLWFLGVYEYLLHGDAAPPFAREMMPYAAYGTIVAATLVLLTYPLAWARIRKAAIEGSRRTRRPPAQWRTRLLHRVIRRPAERVELHYERSLSDLLLLGAGVAALHTGLSRLQGGPAETEEEREGYEGEFQVLGLS